MTLHEAIQKVLKDAGKPMNSKEIAEIINSSKLYIRRDGNPVPRSQVQARVKKYPELFKNIGLEISIVSDKNQINAIGYQGNNDFNFFDKDKYIDDGERYTMYNSIYYDFNNLIDRNKNLHELSTADILNRISIDDLFREMASTFKAMGIKSNMEIQIASLVFTYRIVALYKDDKMPTSYHDPILSTKLKSTNIGNPTDLFEAILYINKTIYFNGILDKFLQAVNNQFSPKIKLILGLLGGYDFSYQRFNHFEFGKAFSAFIKSFIIEKNRAAYELSSSLPLIKLTCGLVQSNIKDGSVIYDPAAGIGSFFIEIQNNLSEEIKSKVVYKGQEIDNLTAVLCRMNLFMNGIFNSEINTGDSLLYPSVKASTTDVAVCEFPYFTQTNLSDKTLSDIDYLKNPSNDVSSLFIQLITSRLRNDGIMVAAAPSSFLARSKTSSIRKDLVKSDLIDLILDLPSGFGYNSSIRLCIIVLRKNKPKYSRNRITFIDTFSSEKFQIRNSERDKYENEAKILAEAITKSQLEENYFNENFPSGSRFKIRRTVIETGRIEENNFILNPSLYVSKQISVLERITASGEKLVRLKDILEDTKTKPIKSDNIGSDVDIPYIQIRDLSNSKTNFSLNQNKLKTQSSKRGVGRLINRNAVLVARIGERLKPTLYEYKNTPIIISNNVSALFVNDTLVNPEYLIYQLNSEVAEEQINAFRTGIAQPFIRFSDLLGIKIPLPSISEQINRVAEFHKEQSQKSQLAKFLNSIRLVEDQNSIKSEMESFTRKYFPQAEQIIFRTELQFERFPFTSQDIESEKYVVKTRDKLLNHMLIINDGKEILGVVTVSEENEIMPEIYEEINAYGKFLIKTTNFIKHSNASNMLAKFAHSSKNFFVGISMEMDAIINTENRELKELLESNYIDREDVINRLTEDGETQKYDLLAMNKLKAIREKISKVAGFYTKTSTLYKAISESKPVELDILKVIKSADFNNCVRISCNEKEVYVFAKESSIRQAFADIIQNAYQYSPNRLCDIQIEDKNSYILIVISNSVSKGDLISEEKYRLLGKSWLTKGSGDGASSGLYWASQSVIDSMGELKISTFDTYCKAQIFTIEIKLRKKL